MWFQATFRAFLINDGRFPPVKEGEEGREGVARSAKPDRKIHCLVWRIRLARRSCGLFVRLKAKSLAPTPAWPTDQTAERVIPKYRADKLAGFVMFLNLDGGKKSIKIPGAEGGTETTLTVDQEYPDDEKRDGYVAQIRDLASAVNAPHVPFGLAANKSDAASAWKISDKDDVTVIVYYRMRIVGQPWRFAKPADLTDEKVAEILKSAEAAITGRK